VSERRPTGGRIWLPIGGAALAVGLLYLSIFAVPPLITTFVDELGLSHAEAGTLMSVCLGGFLVSSAVSARLAGRFGPIPLVVAGLVLCGIATISFAFTESLAVFLLCRAAIAIAGGLIYAPGVTFVTSLLPFQRANLGVGVFLCGLSIGGTVAFFATRLLSEALDWRWPFWIFGIAVLAGAVAVSAVSGPLSPRGHRVAGAGSSIEDVLESAPFQLLLASLFTALFVAYGVFVAAGGATASGLAASAGMAGAVTSTYLGGWIVGTGDGYGTAFWVYAAAAAVTALALVPLVALGLWRARTAVVQA
jgi:CP family cyanate transporter-like MFS transporter